MYDPAVAARTGRSSRGIPSPIWFDPIHAGLEINAERTWVGSARTPTQKPKLWMRLSEVARYLGYDSKRPPNSLYDLAKRIGRKVNGKWLIHQDALDAEIERSGGVVR